MKAKSEGRRQNEECRSGEKLGSGIRAQSLGCRGLRQLWRNRERRQIVESELTVRREARGAGFEFRCPRQTVFWGWLSNLVEREGVIKFLTVRNLMSPGAESLFGNYEGAVFGEKALRAIAGMQPSTQPPLATSATSNRAAVGSGIGAVRKPRPAWVVCGGCRLKAAFPDRVRRPRRAWLSAHGRQVAERAGLASAGRSADAPACGQAVGSRLARTNLDLGRGRWIRGGSERMNGQAKDLSDRNTCIIYDSAARRSGLEENLRLSSLNGKKMFEGAGWEPDSAGETPTGATETVALPLSLARSVFQKSTKAPRGGTLQE